MRRDKTAARIILILSVVHVAVAAPAIVRQRSLDVDDDVTTASEKRGNPGDTPQDLYPVPQIDNELPTTSGTPHLQSDPPPTSGTPPVDYDRLATAYNVRFYRVWKWLQDVHPPAPIGGTLHSGPEPPPPKLEAPPPPPEANEVFSDAIKQKLKVLAGFGAVASVSAGLVYGVHKLIEDHSHETYVSAFFPSSPADI